MASLEFLGVVLVAGVVLGSIEGGESCTGLTGRLDKLEDVSDKSLPHGLSGYG